MDKTLGLVSAAGAAVCFGVQYVPVKKYEIYDGSTFQWFMCNGILLVGIILAMAFRELEDGCPLPVVAGGVLWGLSNYLVIPLVKLLGIGLGFSLYHFVNLAVGYCTGRWGFFGVPPVQEIFPGSLYLCDFGCVLVLISFVGLLFVEQDQPVAQQSESGNQLPPPIVSGIDSYYRQMYRRWRLGDSRGCIDPPIGEMEVQTPVSACQSFAVGGFSTFGRETTPSAAMEVESRHGDSILLEADRQIANAMNSLGSPTVPGQRTVSSPEQQIPRLLDDQHEGDTSRTVKRRPNPWKSRVLGALLALAGGGLAGLQSVPATLYNTAHPGGRATAVVFPQCLGIWLASTVLYLCYSLLAMIQGWSVPHSNIRPAFFSGSIWAAGFTLMIFGIRNLGYEVGYTLDAVGPIVISSLLSILVFREITDRKQLAVYGAAEALQLVGVILISVFGKND